jgi:hypothetical protein
MSAAYPDWWQMVNEILVEHEGRLSALEQDRSSMHLYGAGTPWPDVAKLQIEELQQTVAAQTATINRLLDRLEYLEALTHRYINQADGDGR